MQQVRRIPAFQENDVPVGKAIEKSEYDAQNDKERDLDRV
jgi:hypothetical protein